MARFFRRRKFCRFTAEGVKEIDYKDLDTLKGYITETGKIVPSTLSASAGYRYQACPLPGTAAVYGRSRPLSFNGQDPGPCVHWHSM